MITPNELRLGNLLLDREGRLCKVEQLSSDINDCKIYAIKGALTSHPISPIPLTREWLSNFKFHQKYTSDPQEQNPSEAWFINDFYIHSVDGSLKFFFHSYEGLIIEIKYVHQLQNLFYCLPGEELTIK